MEGIIEMEQLVSEEISIEQKTARGGSHENSDDDDIVVYDRRDFVTTTV